MLVVPSVTMISANMKCSLKLCSRAEVLEASGTNIQVKDMCRYRIGCFDFFRICSRIILFISPGSLLILVLGLEARVQALDQGGQACTETKAMMISISDPFNAFSCCFAWISLRNGNRRIMGKYCNNKEYFEDSQQNRK